MEPRIETLPEKQFTGMQIVMPFYIFQEWLPRSTYAVDDRPHFAVMGEKYKGENPDSEEELWIPIRPLDSQA